MVSVNLTVQEDEMERSAHQVVIASVVAVGFAILSATGIRAVGEVRHVPRDYPTIQSAVDAAGEGDTIHVAAGNYTEKVVVATSGVRLRAGGGVVLDGTNLGGIGIHVLGASAAAPVTDVEVSGFEVRNFERGIIVQWATGARVSHNHVHDNLDRTAPQVLGDGTGIELVTVRGADVSHNVVTANGLGGIQLRVGSTDNAVHHNRVDENGSQSATLEGVGVMVTGAGTHDNRILHNTIVGNFGRGVMLARPTGTAPITGNLVAYNRARGNHRAGIVIMFSATGNIVVHNDARENNLSGLAPCYQCNLFDLSVGGNTWNNNHGTFNGTSACAP